MQIGPLPSLNPATEFGVLAFCLILATKTVYEMVLLLKKQKNGGSGAVGVYCNFPADKSMCVLQSTDFQKLRTIEIVEGVSDQLKASLDQQNRLLGEIRDSVRDLGTRNGNRKYR